MKSVKYLLCLAIGLLLPVQKSNAFVLLGQMDAAEFASGGVDFNYTDDLGGPKDLKRFFRWNIPMLTYSFDASFMQYFGLEGRDAVIDAFRVVNDFFYNSAYDGVSALEFTEHGFRSNYNTALVNQTAENAQVIDIKSLTLGLIVNHLGLGNPHRYAFGIRGMSTNTVGTQINFNVRLRNYDPITEKPTPYINGVQYSYRLIHDADPSVGFQGVANPIPTFADMEEFTTDTTGNRWSAVSAITDAFYGNSAIYWTELPSLFGFGVYYDGLNALGGQYQPRHALTYDDAGGLKYLYRTNNFVYESLDPNVALILPANFLPTFAIPVFPNGSARVYPDPTGQSGAFIPRRNSGFIPGLPITSVLPAQAPPALIDVALRGGIDKIQFYEQPFDSFLGITFTATSHTWVDTFVSTNGQNVIGLNNTTPGASAYIGVPTLKFFTQTVGRGIATPDILFVADELGVSPDGVPIAWNRTDNTTWIDNFTNNLGPVQLLSTNVGPGIISGPIQYTFSTLGDGFEVIWSGEASVVGNTNSYSMWGHIKGPGPDDVIVFPNDAQIAILENVLAPTTAVPTISRVIDSGGDGSLTRTQESLIIEGTKLASATAIQIMDGNLELQTIQGSTVQRFIRSNQRIEIPPGMLNEQAEGAAGTRAIRIWNTLGVSENSTTQIGISTGLPILTGTSRDNLTFDRAQTLNLFGYGFKSTQKYAVDGNAELTHFRVEDGAGNILLPSSGNSEAVSLEVKSDTHAVLPLNSLTAATDGVGRRLRVARGTDVSALSSTNTPPIMSAQISHQINNYPPITGTATSRFNYLAHVTTKPIISSLRQQEANGTWESIANTQTFKRDLPMEMNGTAFVTAYRVEIVRTDGSPVYSENTVSKEDLPGYLAQFPQADLNQDNFLSMEEALGYLTLRTRVDLPAAGVTVEDNGTRIEFSKDVFFLPDTDGTAAAPAYQFKVYNVVGNTDLNASLAFNVNAQPSALFVAGFATANTFNRDATTGDDVTITGANLKAVTEIQIVDEEGTALSNTPNITLPNPGVTVSDSSILIDTSVAQFQNAPNADSNGTGTSRWRRFRLVSGRDAVLTPQNLRFQIGLPPTYTSYSGLSNTSHYRRDNDSFQVTGANLGLISSVEIVDVNGNTVAANTQIDTTTGVSSSLPTQFTIAANSFPNANLLDSGSDSSRRLKITTPFGSVVSPNTSAGTFTVSATPAFGGNTAATHAGGGFDGGTSTYDLSNGDLVINGSNFLGIKAVRLMDHNGSDFENTYINVSINPAAPPAGISFNNTGTQITIASSYISDSNSSWADSSGSQNRGIKLTTAADQNGTTATQLIITQP